MSARRNLNFEKIWKIVLRSSAVIVAVCILALAIRGLNLGIEFQGGASWEVRSATLDTEQLRETLDPLGVQDARIQQVANDLWRVRAELDSADDLERIKHGIAQGLSVELSEVSANSVGASWGSEVTSKARNALIVFFIVLFVYISVRLEWKAAAAALLAVAHDICVTLGIYAIFAIEVTSATVIAFLTILGYSLYDTLVVFDKIRENERRSANVNTTYTQVVAYSANQVLTRSINTTITSVIPVLSVLLVGRFALGALTLQEFALALLIGLIVGTYSSLFIATPLLVAFKERETEQLKERLEVARSSIVASENLGDAIAQSETRQKEAQRKERQSQRKTRPRIVVTKRSAESD